MGKRNNSLTLIICTIVGALAVLGLTRATSWLLFWICIGVLALAVIVLVFSVLRPTRRRPRDYERRLSDRISEHRK